MKVKIKRIDKSLGLPQYQTEGSIGFDFSARIDVKIKAGEMELVPLNIVMKVPVGYGLFLFSRSSIPKKKGIMVANSVGVIDQDYCGEDDELMVCAYNITKKTVTVERGERIAQGVIMKIAKPEFNEVKKMATKSRGGFGSTG